MSIINYNNDMRYKGVRKVSHMSTVKPTNAADYKYMIYESKRKRRKTTQEFIIKYNNDIRSKGS